MQEEVSHKKNTADCKWNVKKERVFHGREQVFLVQVFGLEIRYRSCDIIHVMEGVNKCMDHIDKVDSPRRRTVAEIVLDLFSVSSFRKALCDKCDIGEADHDSGKHEAYA